MMLRKKQPVLLRNLAVKGIGELVNLLINHFISLGLKDVNSKAELQNSVEWLKVYIFADIPLSLINDITIEVLSVLKKHFQRYTIHKPLESTTKMYPFVLLDRRLEYSPEKVEILKVMMELILHPRLQQLEEFPCCMSMKEVLQKNLPCLTGLTVMDVVFHRSYKNSISSEELFMSGLCAMSNLVKLNLSFICTDKILSVVAETCAKLRFVDISDTGVTDTGVVALIKCKQLQEINLVVTNVSHKGLVQLLCELSLLETCIGFETLGSALESIPNNTELNIRRLERSENMCFTDIQLQLLVKHCPKVQHLELDLSENVTNLNILEKLEELNAIVLNTSEFYTKSVDALLENIGNSLSALHFRDTYPSDFDIGALKHVGTYCPNLKTLELSFYGIEGNLNEIDHNPQNPLFKNVKTLYSDGEICGTHIEFLLTNCPSIENFYVVYESNMTDMTISNILAKNQMKCLKVFVIHQSMYLSINAVRMLMSSCENLETVGHLKNWRSISVDELGSFTDELMNLNVDLKTSYSQNTFSPKEVFYFADRQ